MTPNIVGALRVKNEGRWVRRAIASILPICSRVFVLDDHSEDDTIDQAVSAGPKVHIVGSSFSGIDEVRDKNYLLDVVDSEGGAEWVIMIDGDEEMLGVRCLRLRQQIEIVSYWVDSISLPILFLWDSETQVRVDGVYGDFNRESVFRNTGERFAPTGGFANFHCGNVPAKLRKRRAYCPNAPLLHYGYMDRVDRVRKYAWYNQNDPDNRVEDCYRHMVIGDLPEFPSDIKTKHAGPLVLRNL